MLFKLAWRNIFRNRRRSLITVSSILFAVVCAVFMRSLQFGAYDHMIHNVVTSYLGYVQVHGKGFWEEKNIDLAFDRQALDKVSEIRGVDDLSYRLESFALASLNERSKPVALLGLNPDREKEMMGLNKKVVQGKYLNANDQGLLLSIHLARILQAEIGDTLTLIGQGYHGSYAADAFRIVGIVDLKTPELNKRTVIMNDGLAQEFFGLSDRATSAVIGVRGRDWKKVQGRLQEELGAELEVMNWKQMVPELVQLIRADQAGGTVVLIILYLIIGLGLFGTVLMLTQERRYEYGILIAVGMKRRLLQSVALAETFIMAFLGVVAGIIVAFPVVYYFHWHPIKLTGDGQRIAERFGFEAVLPTSIDPRIALTHAFIIFALVMLVNCYVLYKIKKLKPIQAMHR